MTPCVPQNKINLPAWLPDYMFQLNHVPAFLLTPLVYGTPSYLQLFNQTLLL
jgi:hypothetical protein